MPDDFQKFMKKFQHIFMLKSGRERGKEKKRERESRKIGEIGQIGEIRPIREEKRERTHCVRSLCSPTLQAF